MNDYWKGYAATVQFDSLQMSDKICFWKRCQRKVPLPEFIEQRAKGTMELRQGKVYEHVEMTWQEYQKDQYAALNASINDVYEDMKRDIATIMFGDKK